jgi:cell division protease FtsH
VQLGSGDAEPFLGMTAGQQRDYSDETAKIIGEKLTHQLIKHLAVSVQAIEGFLVGILEKFPNLVALKRWPERGTFTGSDKRVPSSIPPVKPPQIAGVDEDGSGVGGAMTPRRGAPTSGASSSTPAICGGLTGGSFSHGRR